MASGGLASDGQAGGERAGREWADGEWASAEESIDIQTTIEKLGGQEVPVVTGRVLLHVLAADGRGLCGQASDQLTPTGRAWDAGYLPHLPRCERCEWLTRSGAAQAGTQRTPQPGGSPPEPPFREGADIPFREGADMPIRERAGMPPPGLPATGMDIRLAHGTDGEAAGAAVLRDVLAKHDLRRWMFTDLVTIDADIRGGHSHPLTISPPMLIGSPDRALAVFLHEQLHWIDDPGVYDAMAEARNRWPDPPPPPAGCHDAESSWVHLIVCALEYLSLSDLIGPPAAAVVLAQFKHYSWVYDQILGDPAWFSGLLARHGLHIPVQPPIPRRYLGDDWWTAIQ
jgi:hypothetical protein